MSVSQLFDIQQAHTYAGLNIGVQKEAAEQFLAALAMHDSGRTGTGEGDDSMAVWLVLRRALLAMVGPELPLRRGNGG